MKKETVIITLLIIIGIGLGLTANLLEKKTVEAKIISPFSSSFSVFSMLKPRETPNYLVYGFLPYWNLSKIEYLQLDKLTDIAYFGLYLNADGSIRKIGDDGIIDPGYNQWKNNEDLVKLIKAAKAQGVRISLTVISHDAAATDKLLMCESCWATSLKEISQEMDSQGIRDVNLNFEYADYTDESYANQYTKFADFMNKGLDAKFGNSYVVVSTFADSLVKPRVTKVEDLAKVVDGLFIMAYDFHQPGSDNAGPVAPIGGAGVHAEYDIGMMIQDYLKHVHPNKIIMGVPYYGYNWVVTNTQTYAERIPGRDDIGYSQSQAYEHIMDTILEVKPQILWDDLAQSPYFTYTSPDTGSTRQVYFENAQSLKTKYQLIKRNNFAGVGIWALGYDGGYQELWKLLREEFVL